MCFICINPTITWGYMVAKKVPHFLKWHIVRQCHMSHYNLWTNQTQYIILKINFKPGWNQCIYPQLHTSIKPSKLPTIDPIMNITCKQIVREAWYPYVYRRCGSVTQGFVLFCLIFIFVNNSYTGFTSKKWFHFFFSFIVSPELSSERDYVITHSVRSMYIVCMYVCSMW